MALSACKKGKEADVSDNPYTSTKKGVLYQFHQKGKGKKPYRGDVVMMKRILTSKDGTELENNYTSNLYVGHPINNSGPLAKHLDEIFIKSRVGDSLTIKLKSWILYGTSFLPHQLSIKDTIIWQAKVIDIVSFSDYQKLMAKQNAKLDKKRIEDNQKELQAYIKAQNLSPVKLPIGVYCSINTVGNGEKPLPGDSVYVHYTVYRMNGEKADASYDRGRPLPFMVGTGEVINGLDKSIRLLKEGATATILIPSEQAYGAESKGKTLPAHANLRFEIELVKVKK